MSRFYAAANLTPLIRPEDTRPFLADPELHWKKGYSAYELATSWIGAEDIPSPVRDILDTCPVFAHAKLITGFFERQTKLGTPGRASQTDLLAHVWLPSGVGVIGVEGKCEESFGPIVREWNTSPGRKVRLGHLCSMLGLSVEVASSLRYQLIHRTAAALIEAQAVRADSALMLVHSFSPHQTWFNDFVDFSNAMSIPIGAKNCISAGRRISGVDIRLGWVSDKPCD